MNAVLEQSSRRDLRIGLAASLLIHAAALTALGVAFVKARGVFTPPAIMTLQVELDNAGGSAASAAPADVNAGADAPTPSAPPRPAPTLEQRLTPREDEFHDAATPVAVPPLLPAAEKRSFADEAAAASAIAPPASGITANATGDAAVGDSAGGGNSGVTRGAGGDAANGIGIEGPVRFRRLTRPAYPLGARQRGEEGRVILDALVGADGRPLTVSVAQGSGFWELDRAASRAVKRALFTPALENGRPVNAHARITIVFKLVN
jgi:protein TonB